MKLKKEFQLSLWEDFMDTKTTSSNETISFINERKICDIASDLLENPRAAYNVVFKSKTDGTHVLTFDITSRYWDQQEQDFIENPIIKYLYNEAKVKLHYKNKWYDLIIKNCQENSKEKKYSYTCEDLFIDELGRNGYNVEFSTELGGNVNTVTELADEALKGSDWTVDKEKSVKPVQKISEPVYAYKIPGGSIAYVTINEDGSEGDGGRISVVDVDNPPIIYILYSCAHDSNLEGKDYQFYYDPSGKYEVDDDGNFVNINPKYIRGLTGALKHPEGKLRIQYSSATHTFVPQYRGNRYIRSPKTEWLPKIKRQVTVYKDADNKEYYGYKKTTYLSPEIAHNLLINSKPGAFNGSSGWLAETTVNGVKKDCLIEMTLTTKDDETLSLSLGTPSNLKAYYFDGDTKKEPTSPVKFINLAFKNNLKNIGAISKGDRFVVRLKQFWISGELENVSFLGDSFDYVGATGDVNKPILVNYPTNDGYYYIIYEANRSFSYKELLNEVSHAPVFSVISNNGIFKGGDLFRYYTYTDSNGDKQLITPEITIQSQNLIKNEYYYFTKEQYKACTNEDDLQMSFKSDEELDYVYRENQFEKIATLEVKESNYFNIIQTLNEKFECWAKFEIAHEENGATSVDAAGKRIKKVTFCDYIGRENFAGFKYGINLDSIQRTVDSKEITTKTIVKANSNEFAPNGSCNIARASQNPSGAQFILNFDYFTHQKVLKQFEVDNDLYLEKDGYLGYYTKLKRLNGALQEIENQLIAIESNIIKADRDIQAANVNEEDFLEDINNINAKLANNYISIGEEENKMSVPHLGVQIFNKSDTQYGDVYKWTYPSLIIFYKVNEEDGSAGDAYPPGQQIIYNVENGKKLVDTYNNFIESRFNAIKNKRKLEEDKAFLIAQRDGEYSYVDVDGNPRIIKYKNGKWYKVLLGPITKEISEEKIKINPELETDITIITETADIEEYIWNLNKLVGGITYDKIKERLSLGETLIDSDLSPDIPINQNLQPLLPSIKQLDSQFYSKYSRFIREGTWTSEDYTDDNLYYLDACSVAYTSAFPKTTYSISVVDIKSSIVPDELGYDYSAYDFECGDFTTMEDTEFFGWKEDGITPYKEKIIISETEEHLDNISANKITVQNYKTQFDELFQRITAATQTLELKQGEYERASKVVNVNGEINKTFLQNTLYNNNLILENMGAQEVIWGSEGIISTDLNNPLLKTRVVGGGIVITEDGGETWSTGISGQGINASMIRTGQLDANRIRIMNGNDASFFWDSEGILAYSKANNGGYNYDKYVKFNRQGIEGKDTEKLVFKLDWDGIIAKKGQIGNWYIGDYSLTSGPIGNEGSFHMYTEYHEGSVKIAGKDDSNWRLTIGNNFGVDKDGGMYAASGNIGGWDINQNYIGSVGSREGTNGGRSVGFRISSPLDTDGDNSRYWLVAGKLNAYGSWEYPFKVGKNGALTCTGAEISGIITATSGNIGGWDIRTSGTTGTLAYVYGSGENRRGIGIQANGTGSAVFAAGFKVPDGQSPHDVTWGTTNTPFYVTPAGILHATGAVIDGNSTFSGNVHCKTLTVDDTVQVDGKFIKPNSITSSQIESIVGTKISSILNSSVIPELSASKITSGTLGQNVIIPQGVTIGGAESYLSIEKLSGPTGIMYGLEGYGASSYNGGCYIGLTGTYYSTNLRELRIACSNSIGIPNRIDFSTDKQNTSGDLSLYAGRYGYFYGNWYESSGDFFVTSDKNKKNSFNPIEPTYELFFDNLNPCLYKYNNGTSNRFHTGFIAQEVKEALDIANISTQNFAGLGINKYTKDSGEEVEDWYLRYGEFIPLNTWQIQKLKTRVTDLETEISNLKLQLKNLQNS